jgi:hypothetical protein
LPFEEMPLNALGQRRRGRQDSGGENQGGAQPQDGGEEEMTPENELVRNSPLTLKQRGLADAGSLGYAGAFLLLRPGLIAF